MCQCQRHSDTLWDLCTTLIMSRQRLALLLTSSNMMLDNSCAVCSDTTLKWAPGHHERARQHGGTSPAMAPSQTWNRCGKTPRVYRRDALLTAVFSLDNRVGEYRYVMSPTTLD